MSHLKERKEKNCLNCNAAVIGTYCHICGQENIEPKESFFHLVNHYFQDITHFDGKFFSTLKYLIIRPGFLTSEYNAGRRASYLNPIRMYVFTSALFFLIFFTIVDPNSILIKKETYPGNAAFTEVLNKKIAEARKSLTYLNYGSSKEKLVKKMEQWQTNIENIKRDPLAGIKIFTELQKEEGFIHVTEDEFKDVSTYDSVQNKLSTNKRDNFFIRKIRERGFELNDKFQNNPEELKEKIFEKFLHKFPQILFISLPLFALFLQFFNFRHKELYYVNHLIFSIHFYIYAFIALLMVVLLQKLQALTHWGFLDIVLVLLNLSVFLYQYKAMRNFYQQSRLKTFAKLLIIDFLSLIFMLLLFTIFFFYSFFQI